MFLLMSLEDIWWQIYLSISTVNVRMWALSGLPTCKHPLWIQDAKSKSFLSSYLPSLIWDLRYVTLIICIARLIIRRQWCVFVGRYNRGKAWSSTMAKSTCSVIKQIRIRETQCDGMPAQREGHQQRMKAKRTPGRRDTVLNLVSICWSKLNYVCHLIRK